MLQTLTDFLQCPISQRNVDQSFGRRIVWWQSILCIRGNYPGIYPQIFPKIPHQKIEFPCLSPDCGPHIGQEVSLVTFRQILSKTLLVACILKGIIMT